MLLMGLWRDRGGVVGRVFEQKVYVLEKRMALRNCPFRWSVSRATSRSAVRVLARRRVGGVCVGERFVRYCGSFLLGGRR